MDGLVQGNISYRKGEEINPSNLSRADVELYALNVAKAGAFDSTATANVRDLVIRFGGRVHVVPMDELLDGRTGAVYVHGKFNFDVQVPDHTSPLRDRFTIAHELGHYFLHSQQGSIPIIAYRRGSGRTEWEANWFAAALLMPEKLFREAAASGMNTFQLASRFGVSVDAAEVRRNSLNLA